MHPRVSAARPLQDILTVPESEPPSIYKGTALDRILEALSITEVIV